MTDEVEQSLEAKIAAKFGTQVEEPQDPGETGEGGEESQVQGDDFADIEFEGASYKVPSKLKDAFMKNYDYTKKTETLAEQMRAMDIAREGQMRSAIDSKFQESVVSEQRELNVIEAYLSETSKINWQAMDLPTMMKTRAEIDQVKERRTALREAIEGKHKTYTDEIQNHLSQLRAKSREAAVKSIPNYSEETEKLIRSTAKAEGLSEGEIDNVLLDPRSHKLLWKAAQWDKVQANLGKADKVTKALRPGASSERMPATKVAELNYRKAMKGARNSNDKARLIEERLAHNSVFNPRG